ncbi:RIP metalloprotease RseP [Pararhodobacter sp. SW119]|uniref:RIP metalloprotease RseP n=1 Tax=Pararhodobacter sp. SW119 TaxID=2780075 RepID=UPI001AE03C8C|nr:RIP metalloprotease RseP [Pararhodobacter sp. SW119]
MDLFGLLPEFGNVFFTLGAFVVALSVIVAVHEYGHYIVGRWSGIHAEVFSIGFGPVLFSRVDQHGTRWQVAALPFGGYVKFLGDSNAASATDADAVARMDRAQRRRSMPGAPLWARSATVAAGPVFNFIFSILVFALFIGVRGIAEDTPVIGEIHPLPATVQELREGDRILAIEGRPTETLADFFAVSGEIEPAPIVDYTVERAGQRTEVAGPFPVPPRAAGISLNSAARDAGMQPGDVILSVADTPIHAFSELPPIVGAAEGDPVALRIWRDGEELDLALTPRRTDLPVPGGGFETRWLIGLESGAFFDHPVRRPGPVEVLPMAAAQTWSVVARSFDGLYHMVVGAISTCNLSGPIGIARVSGAMAADGIWNFIWFIAVLSTAVGLLNLFPIPVLDGGHLVFHAYEAITGRPPNERVVGAMMTVGLMLLLSLMAFAVFNDLMC